MNNYFWLNLPELLLLVTAPEISRTSPLSLNLEDISVTCSTTTMDYLLFIDIYEKVIELRDIYYIIIYNIHISDIPRFCTNKKNKKIRDGGVF